MRRFEFRLDAALRWRRSQFEMEEARLRNLFAELAAIQTGIAELDAAQAPERTAVHSPAATPGERAALDAWLRWARAERGRLLARAADCERRIAEQRARVLEARRGSELLAKLRSRKLADWTAELNKDVEQIAADAYAAKWSR
jgi:hypothetical protein